METPMISKNNIWAVRVLFYTAIKKIVQIYAFDENRADLLQPNLIGS